MLTLCYHSIWPSNSGYTELFCSKNYPYICTPSPPLLIITFFGPSAWQTITDSLRFSSWVAPSCTVGKVKHLLLCVSQGTLSDQLPLPIWEMLECYSGIKAWSAAALRTVTTTYQTIIILLVKWVFRDKSWSLRVRTVLQQRKCTNERKTSLKWSLRSFGTEREIWTLKDSEKWG